MKINYTINIETIYKIHEIMHFFYMEEIMQIESITGLKKENPLFKVFSCHNGTRKMFIFP